MPYVFVFLLVVNILALGYFAFINNPKKLDSPAEVQAKESINEVISMRSANQD